MISSLSIFHKMLIPPLLAIALFGVYIVNIYKEQLILKEYIFSIQKEHFPIMKISNENELLLDHITQSFEDAVGAKEKDWLDNTIVYKDIILKNIKTLEDLELDKNTLKKIEDSFNNYFSTSMKLSILMIESETSFSEIESLANNMSKSLSEVKELFKLFQKSQNINFSNTIKTTHEHQNSIFKLGLFIGIFSLFIILLITLYLSIITNKSLKELLLSFKNIADGNPDFTKRIKVESKDELGELVTQFNRFTKKLQIDYNELRLAKQDAEKVSKIKSEFVANMSHEIRTPLNAIIGFSELLEQSEISSKQKGYLKSIVTGGETLLGIVNDILDLSKMESGKLEIQNQAFSIKDIVIDTKMMFEEKAKEKGLDLILTIEDNVPDNIISDEIRIKQILLNIIGNAIKFTNQGYIKIDIKSIENPKDSNFIDLDIYVIDTGIGIDKDQQRRIFDTFVQQEGQSNREYGGTGLGLSICKKLIHLMNGTLNLNSKKGQGSTFLVGFKNVKVSKEPIKKEQKNINSEIIDFEEANILLVDDIELNRALIKKFLSHTKLNFHEATNGKEAIEKCKQLSPDLILMDLRMPIMSGFEATKILKNDITFSKIPVIAVSASSRSEDKNTKGCFDEYISKPLDLNLLLKKLSYFLAHKKVLITKENSKDSLLENSKNIELLFQNNFDENLKKNFLKALRGFSFEDTLEFVDALTDFAKQHNAEILLNFSKELKRSAENFDIRKMEIEMNKISPILKKVY